MYNRHTKRLAIAEYYSNHRVSIRETARMFGVHYQSVFKWVKKYREKGAAGLLDCYKKPWNRTKAALEENIVKLKESDPTLTLRKTQSMLRSRSISISLKGIWQVWRRFGYAGFNKKHLSSDFIDYCAWTQESRSKFKQARALYRRGEVAAVAHVLNSIPMLPHNHFLAQIPEDMCSLPRKVERRSILFGEIPLAQYLEKVRTLYKECIEKDMRYLALRVGISEITALSWGIRADEQLQKTEELISLLDRRGAYYSNLLFAPRMILKISKGISLAHRSEITRATRCAQEIRRMLKQRSYLPHDFMVHLGTLYSQLENYCEAEKWFRQALAMAHGSEKRSLYTRFAENVFLKGEYSNALQMLRRGGMHGWINETRKLFYRAMQNFMKGMPGRSIELAGKALSIAQKDGLDWGLIKAYNAIASAYLSLGETRKAAAAIERLIAYSKKLKRAETAMEILLSKDSLPPLRLSKDTLPTTRLAVLLKRGQYRKAYRLAQQKGIMAYLHRFIFYAPEGVHRSIQTGKSTGLPRGILQLPVFNKAMPVYSIRFLGRLVVHKDRRYVKQRLGPKDRALLIHFALRIGEPGMSVSVHRVCHNFWEHRKDPIQNLSHAILRLKKALKIPSHFLVIQQVRGESVVINRGFYCMTDYAELEQKYTTAHAFERVGEYGFARDDYLTALQLVRGRFFHRMYDTWSEDVRGAIANKIENTVGRLNEIHRDQAPDPTIERISDRMRRVLGY